MGRDLGGGFPVSGHSYCFEVPGCHSLYYYTVALKPGFRMDPDRRAHLRDTNPPQLKALFTDKIRGCSSWHLFKCHVM